MCTKSVLLLLLLSKLLNLKVSALANSAGESFIKTINPQLYKQMIKGARITDVTDVVDILR